jgi:hypothetical protein
MRNKFSLRNAHAVLSDKKNQRRRLDLVSCMVVAHFSLAQRQRQKVCRKDEGHGDRRCAGRMRDTETEGVQEG